MIGSALSYIKQAGKLIYTPGRATTPIIAEQAILAGPTASLETAATAHNTAAVDTYNPPRSQNVQAYSVDIVPGHGFL